MLINSTNSRTNSKKYTNLDPGTRRTFQERYQIEKSQALTLSDPQIYLYDLLAGQDVEFASVDEFMTELGILLTDWGGQRFFYETPQRTVEGTKIKLLKDLEGQATSTDIKLYSARGADDVLGLYKWANTNGIAMSGFDAFTATGGDDAPFKGHFGDRAHTVKHYRQKGEGTRLICLHLNTSGSKDVRAVRNDPSFISRGGEGSVVGGFGLKSENGFVSVALGQSRETWDYMKTKVQLVTLVK